MSIVGWRHWKVVRKVIKETIIDSLHFFIQKGETMKKLITYTEEQVMLIQLMLNAITVTGIQNAKQVAAIAQMLKSGMPAEINEKLK